jgi:hypothetical protein
MCLTTGELSWVCGAIIMQRRIRWCQRAEPCNIKLAPSGNVIDGNACSDWATLVSSTLVVNHCGCVHILTLRADPFRCFGWKDEGFPYWSDTNKVVVEARAEDKKLAPSGNVRDGNACSNWATVVSLTLVVNYCGRVHILTLWTIFLDVLGEKLWNEKLIQIARTREKMGDSDIAHRWTQLLQFAVQITRFSQDMPKWQRRT